MLQNPNPADRASPATSTGSGGPAFRDLSDGSSHLGRADAALALDEEVRGKVLARPPFVPVLAPIRVPAAVQVLQGAYPGATIRRVRALSLSIRAQVLSLALGSSAHALMNMRH